ncbi:hypothetical protein I588_00308 [Enterococcus pallens ATCC BAA-351]|uniref:HTH araC/xylS-type domain-containing protein n=2 Tax=Enterococcus pallens TaxID=160454 RepID=R2QDI2_9ENTE|nr:AraC family transcriptional regulator [Enterococcus pallens]EOH94442.1 hypothetical protein UAU_02177 [Enterococcus pallens ATCC BAA-351]EOU24321.1 hypothetical protein I588_00308 [Enterococcus pallens ATCC BAA-351]OJG81897.1 hypothetical protein RV10_GL001761 [Enterococcus pallens]
MMHELRELLQKELPVETLQRQSGKNINEMNLNYEESIVPKIPVVDFFEEGNIFINKHPRFSHTPAHTHSFVEFNYVYTGSCVQWINGDRVALSQGQLILMDRNIIQQIDYVGEEDLILNILVQDSSIPTELLNNLAQSEDIVTQFIVQASQKQASHNNFMVFDLTEQKIAKQLIELMALKFFQPQRNKARSLNLLLSALLVELSNTTTLYTNNTYSEKKEIFQLLKYINDHYCEVSLKQLGDHFGYNKNYISNMIKAKTGSTFQELIDQKRLSEAKIMLQNTNYSISEIAEAIGYKSTPSIFKLFQQKTGQTPNDFRQKKKSQE